MKSIITLILCLGLIKPFYARDLIPLKAGNLKMVFDKDNVSLRYIKLGKHEILRGVNAPIRDNKWGTLQPQIKDFQLEQSKDSFNANFRVICKQDDIDFIWTGSIKGSNKGEIDFTFSGKANSDFESNRIGICVMYGPDVVGTPFSVKTVQGTSEQKQFPFHISPFQVAKNIRMIHHKVTDKLQSRAELYGEIFEMEDQRNWTDASFKVYPTPLKKPYTFSVKKGHIFEQRFHLEVNLKDQSLVESNSHNITITPGRTVRPLSKIGLMVASQEEASPQQIKYLKALNLNHLRVDLELSVEKFSQNLLHAIKQAKSIGVPLTIGIKPGNKPNYTILKKIIDETNISIFHWLVLDTKSLNFISVQNQLSSISENAPIGIGVSYDFAGFNRNRPSSKNIDFYSWGLNPIIHAPDNETIMESMCIHADTVYSARAFCEAKPFSIGPIALKLGNTPTKGKWPDNVDERQTQSIAAVFAMGSIKHLSQAGVSDATFFETIGWKGLIESENISNRPKAFPSKAGQRFPVYYLFRELAEFKGGMVQEVYSSHPLKVVALSVKKQKQSRLFIANMTHQPVYVKYKPKKQSQLKTQILPVNLVSNKIKLPRETNKQFISLAPYSIIKIDTTE